MTSGSNFKERNNLTLRKRRLDDCVGRKISLYIGSCLDDLVGRKLSPHIGLSLDDH